jgi:hypothetical protein
MAYCLALGDLATCLSRIFRLRDSGNQRSAVAEWLWEYTIQKSAPLDCGGAESERGGDWVCGLYHRAGPTKRSAGTRRMLESYEKGGWKMERRDPY